MNWRPQMFDLRVQREIARKALKFGASSAEANALLTDIAGVSDADLASYESTFKVKSEHVANLELERRATPEFKAKVARGDKEVAEERKARGDLHIPRDKRGNIRPAPPETPEQEKRRLAEEDARAKETLEQTAKREKDEETKRVKAEEARQAQIAQSAREAEERKAKEEADEKKAAAAARK